MRQNCLYLEQKSCLRRVKWVDYVKPFLQKRIITIINSGYILLISTVKEIRKHSNG